MVSVKSRIASITAETRASSEPQSGSEQPRRSRVSTRSAIFALAVIVLIYTYSALFVPQQRPGEPLVVIIRDNSGDIMLLDAEFTEDYDYSSLWRKLVIFYDAVRSSDYSATSERETTTLEFENASEIHGYLQNQSIPNVVTGFTMYFLKQYIDLSVSDPDGLAELPQGKLMGDVDLGVSYEVSSELGMGTFDGLSVFKFSGRSTLFRIEIDAGETISNMLTGYPEYPVYKIVHWKVPRK